MQKFEEQFAKWRPKSRHFERKIDLNASVDDQEVDLPEIRRAGKGACAISDQ